MSNALKGTPCVSSVAAVSASSVVRLVLSRRVWLLLAVLGATCSLRLISIHITGA